MNEETKDTKTNPMRVPSSLHILLNKIVHFATEFAWLMCSISLSNDWLGIGFIVEFIWLLSHEKPFIVSQAHSEHLKFTEPDGLNLYNLISIQLFRDLIHILCFDRFNLYFRLRSAKSMNLAFLEIVWLKDSMISRVLFQ